MKTIFYELNEIPRQIFDKYSSSSKYLALKRLRENAELFETISQDEGHLSPWVTWPSLHRGVSNITHKISILGQDLLEVNDQFPSVWDILRNHGVTVGVFGSLHSYPIPADLTNIKFYVPDTFASAPECFPSELSAFQRFNLSMVSVNGKNVSSKLKIFDAVSFLINARKLGLRGITIFKILKQLISEKIDKKRIVRRRTTQSQIAFDLYLKQLTHKTPDVSFFFTNHVASSLHRYWPTIFPEDYPENSFDRQWLNDWKNEIPHSLLEADEQLASLIDFVDAHHDYRLIALSSMGQAAVGDAKPLINQVLITDIAKLLRYFGVERFEWESRLAMAPEVIIKTHTENARNSLIALKELKINDQNIEVSFLEKGEVLLKINLGNIGKLEVMNSQGIALSPSDVGIEIVNLQDGAGSNAYHIPEGILVVYSGLKDSNQKHNSWRRVSALDIAPSLLKEYGITPPSYMKDGKNIFKIS